MSILSSYFRYLTTETSRPLAQRVFTIGVYGWFFCMALSLWNVRDLVWGPGTVLMRYSGDSSPQTNVAFALMYRHSLFPWVYYPHLLLAFVSMFQFRWVFVFRFLTWISGVLLFYGGVNAFNASYLMMLLFAFYCIPVNTGRAGGIQIVLNQLSRTAVIVQICMVYFLSALYKLSGDMWLHGEAIYYTLELDRFSREWIQSSGITQSKWLMCTLNYFALGYQLLFPVLVFIRRISTPVLVVGIVFHLTTAMVMHLWDFGTAMLISYLIFIRK